jgi:putative flippase GtrA
MMKWLLLLQHKFLAKTFYRYVLVGILNTLISLGIIWTLFYGFSVDYRISYFIGTCIGILSSFVLNRSFTFRSKAPWLIGLIKFLLSSAVSYLVSNFCLMTAVEKLNLAHSLAFLLAMVSYTVVNYLLNKTLVFKTSEKSL